MSTYGYMRVPISYKDRFIAIDEINRGIGIKTTARVTSKEESVRSVDMWRIPKGKIWDIFTRVSNQANQEFKYDIEGIQDVQYLEYNVGDYYDIHSDIDNGIGGQRKISMTWTLNDDYEGGDLRIYYGGEKVVIHNKSTEVVAFTSFMNHSVSIINKGTRKVLVCWIKGKRWQ